LLSKAVPVAIAPSSGARFRPVLNQLPAERVLPVLPGLTGLFPSGGIPKGATILLGPLQTSEALFRPANNVSGSSPAQQRQVSGLTSLLLLLLAGVSSQGHWCAVAGLEELGLVVAAEMGADLDRLVLVPRPGSQGRWQSVVMTLLETVDLICFAPDTPVRATDARRLSARARERASSLVVFDQPRSPSSASGLGCSGPRRPVAKWPGPSDLRCAVRTSAWSGLEHGHGLLSGRQLEVEVSGRGAASRPRRGRLRLPA
jgi:hypothetical protein